MKQIKYFEGLMVNFCWSEYDFEGIEEGTIYEGEDAYKLLKKIREVDLKLNNERIATGKGGYRKTKIGIKWGDFTKDFENGFRVDLGDGELIEGETLADGLKHRFMEFINYAQKDKYYSKKYPREVFVQAINEVNIFIAMFKENEEKYEQKHKPRKSVYMKTYNKNIH